MLQTDVDVDGLRFPSNTHINLHVEGLHNPLQDTAVQHGEGGSMPNHGSRLG